MQLDEAGERANRLVAAWIVRRYRSDGGNAHLRVCPDASVEVEGYDSQFGCDTGCEYARLEATIACPHGDRDEDFEYGQFGELADLLNEIETEMTR